MSFFGLCKDIKIAIKELKIKYPIFMVKQRNYNLILSQSFLNLIKYSQEYKSSDILTLLSTYIFNH